MTEIQVLDGMLDPTLHDAEGRRHGDFEYVGEPCGDGKNWKLIVTYSHGVQQFPVRWMNPSIRIEKRSRSFYEDDQQGKGPIILRPDGWTRIYEISLFDEVGKVIWEGFKGPSTPTNHVAYENGKAIVYRDRWTKVKRSRCSVPPPTANKWPTQWDPIPSRRARSVPIILK